MKNFTPSFQPKNKPLLASITQFTLFLLISMSLFFTVLYSFKVIDTTFIESAPSAVSVSPEQIQIEKLLEFLPASVVNQIKPWFLSEQSSRFDYSASIHSNGKLIFTNPTLDLNVSFSNRGIDIQQQKQSLHFSMQLQAYGYSGKLHSVPTVEPRYHENIVYYPRDPRFIEWYANSKLGLEQFFTIMSPPVSSDTQNTELEIQLLLEGNVNSVLRNDILVFTNPSGEAKYQYKDLKVFDATGKILPAEFKLKPQQLSILIDTDSAVYPITVDPIFANENNLISGDSIIDDSYGYAVDIEGDTAIVSAIGVDIPDPINSGMLINNVGAVYVFTRQTGDSWALQQKLFAENPAPFAGEWFGYDVALGVDTIMAKVPIGTSAPTGTGLPFGDAVLVFERTGVVWNQTQIISGLGLYANSQKSMAIDGNVAVIGTSDAVSVLTKTGNTWSKVASLISSDLVSGDRFGYSVAIRGNTIVVGAPYADLGTTLAPIVDAGVAYVFVKPPGGWVNATENKKLVARMLNGNQVLVNDFHDKDNYGLSVDVDGSTVIVGSPYIELGTGIDIGAAYIYTGSGNTWALEEKVDPADANPDNYIHFGTSVTISGNNAMIGSPLSRASNGQPFGGAIYHFNRTGTNWSQVKKLLAEVPKVLISLGHDSAISGNMFVTGGPGDNRNVGEANIYETGIDLSIVKTASVNGFALPGVRFDYQLTVTNPDPLLTANAVVITDTIPLGMAVAAVSAGCVSIPATTITFECDLGSIPAGTTKSATLNVSVANTGMVTNVASVVAAQGDSVTANNNHIDSVDTVINTPPVGNSQSLTMLQGTFLDVMLTGSDGDLDLLVFTIAANPLNGGLSGNGANIRYTPNVNFFGSDSFSFSVSDGKQTSTPVNIAITVTPVNRAPTPLGDKYSLKEGATLSIAAPGLLQNDTDPDGDLITLNIIPIISPSFGSLTIAADGSFTYIHDGSESITDNFSYQISDPSLLTGVADVLLTIIPVNDIPQASDQNYAVNEGGTFTTGIPGLLSNAIDPDVGDSLQVVGVVANTGPYNGSVTVNMDGSFDYIHDGSETTSDSFAFKIRDLAGATSIATVTFTVNPINDAPVAINDNYGVAEAATLTVSAAMGLLANDTDKENSPLSVSAVVVAPSFGLVTVGSDGSFNYTHDGSETLTDSFDYKISDGFLSAVATVSISVTPVNDAPIASNSSEFTAEDTTLTGQLLGSDAENSPIGYTLLTLPSIGLVNLNTQTGSYSYIPTKNKNGSDVFSFKVNDGLLESTEAFVNIDVSPRNDAPTASVGTLAVIEDIEASGVLVAQDIDGDSLTYSVVRQPAKGVITSLNINTGAYTYKPNLNLTGADSFTFNVSDGKVSSSVALISVNISLLQDSPIANPLSIVTDEDVTVTAQLIAIDPDGDALTYIIDSEPTKGTKILDINTGAFSYKPYDNQNGPDSFTYHVSDGLNVSAVATVSISILAVNDVPSVENGILDVEEDISITDSLIAADIDGDSLTFEIVNPASKGSVDITNVLTGAYIYRPAANKTGADSFTFKVGDGSAFSIDATVNISIASLNDAPVADGQDINVDEDASLSIILTGSDVDNDSFSFSIGSQPNFGTLSGTPPNVVYTPDANFDGIDNFNFTVTDTNSASQNADVTIAINPINDAPVAPFGVLQAQQDQASSAQLMGADVDGDALVYSSVSDPSRGILTLADNGQYIYEPGEGDFGKDEFSYQVYDGVLTSDIAVVTVYVNAMGNTAPSKPVLVLPEIAQTTDSGTSVTFVWNKSVDVDADVLSYQIQYCDSELFNGCDAIDIDTTLSASSYINIGGSMAGLMLFGLVGSNRRRKLRHMLSLVAIVLLLNACSNAADEAGKFKITDSQLSYTATDLAPGTNYYWKIQTEDGRGGVSISELGRFTTLN